MNEFTVIEKLPCPVPEPKYRLFQCTPKGTVVGYEYVSAAAALAEGLSWWGWVYAVRPWSGVGMTAEELVGKKLEGQRVRECDIEAQYDDPTT